MNRTSDSNIIDGFDFSQNLIRYKGGEYPFRTIWIGREYHHVIVSVSSLNDALFAQYGCWPDSLAEYIDGKIFYYVEDSEIQKSDRHLQQMLINVLS